MAVDETGRVEEDAAEPWRAVSQLIGESDAEGLQDYFDSVRPAETARVVSRLSNEERTALFTLLQPEEAAEVLEDVSDAQAADVIEELSPEQAAAIVDELPSDQQADVLAELDADDAEEILQRMEPGEASDVRRLLQYDPYTAGGVMITEFLSYGDQQSVSDLLDDLRTHGDEYADYDVQYAYATTSEGVLTGVLRLRDILFADRTHSVAETMIPGPIHVSVHSTLEELRELFDEKEFVGIPVTDDEGRLVGVVQRAAVAEAVDEQANRTMLRMVGISGSEELRTMPLVERSRRRLSWLSINVVLNMIAASVIAMYQETLEQAIVLAVFLPIISDMSGCSGNQAVAVSLRELTVGLIKPNEMFHVFRNEITIGLMNGAALGLLLGGAAYLWQGNPYLGAVVGGALAANTIVAVCLGGLLPLILRTLKFDPALAAAPILTTVTDMCGFFIMLSLASAILSKLAV